MTCVRRSSSAARRKILVNYAKRQVGNKVSRRAVVAPAAQAQHVGRDPADLRVVDHPVAGHRRRLVRQGDSLRWLKDLAGLLSPGQPIYVILYAAAIVFFCFFTPRSSSSSRETADNLKSGASSRASVRATRQARHIDRILSRLTLGGAVYITLVCLLPEFLVLKYNVPFYFGGTSAADHRRHW